MIIDPKTIIIAMPARKTLGHRAAAVVFFFLFWAALLYLLRPFLVIIGWWLGYGVYEVMAAQLPLSGLFEIAFFHFLPIILLLSCLLWGWAIYNRMRFRGKRDKRRAPQLPLTVPEIATAYPLLTLKEIYEMRDAKGVICHFRDSGELESVDCCRTTGELCLAYNRATGARLSPPAGAWPMWKWEPFGSPPLVTA